MTSACIYLCCEARVIKEKKKNMADNVCEYCKIIQFEVTLRDFKCSTHQNPVNSPLKNRDPLVGIS